MNKPNKNNNKNKDKLYKDSSNSLNPLAIKLIKSALIKNLSL